MQVYSIQVLRGICALLVVWAHSYGSVNDLYPGLGTELFSFGFVGVDIFFIISGFIIAYVTQSKREQHSLTFLVKRFFRVVPLAWLAIITFGFTSGYSLSDMFQDTNFIKNIFFIPPNQLVPPSYGYGFLIVTWTLIYELLFYVIFALAMLINARYRSAIATIMILVLFTSLQLYLSAEVSFNTHNEVSLPNWGALSVLLGIFANPMMLYFVVGMILSEIYSKLPEKNIIAVNYMSVATIILSTTCLVMVKIAYNRLETVGPWCILIVISFLLWEKLGTFKANSYLMGLGTITYSLYLFHVPIQQFFYSSRHPELAFFYAGFSGFPKMIFFTMFSILISSVIYVLIEKQFIKLAKFIVIRIEKRRLMIESKNLKT